METQNNKVPDVVFIYPEVFPAEVISDETSAIKFPGLDLQILKRENDAYNGLEWLIPTAFGVYILKPYFDSFLSEAGKDHYQVLKMGLKKLIEKGKEFKTSAIASSLSTNKLSPKYSQSLTISVEAQTVNKRHLKLLFDNNLDIVDWNNGLDQLLELLADNHEHFPNDILTTAIAKLNTKPHRIIYLVIDPVTKQLVLNDDDGMLQRFSK